MTFKKLKMDVITYQGRDYYATDSVLLMLHTWRNDIRDNNCDWSADETLRRMIESVEKGKKVQ